MCIGEIVNVRECPLCHKTDKIDVFSESSYNKCFGESATGMISMTCERCDIEVWQRVNNDEETYDEAVKKMVAKWNRLRSVEDEDN